METQKESLLAKLLDSGIDNCTFNFPPDPKGIFYSINKDKLLKKVADNFKIELISTNEKSLNLEYGLKELEDKVFNNQISLYVNYPSTIK